MNLKTSTYMARSIAAAMSLVMVNSLGAQAFAYKDRDHDDKKDLKQTIYCLKHHGGETSPRITSIDVEKSTLSGSRNKSL
jgi:hypothetical protein